MDSFRSLLPYLKMHSRQYLIGMLAVIVANSVNLLYPYLVRRIIDGLTGQTDGVSTTAGITLDQAGWFAAGIVLVSLIAGGFMLVMRRQIVVASRQMEYEIRRDIFAHLQTLDKNYYDRARTGDLMNRLTGDLGAVREMLGLADKTMQRRLFGAILGGDGNALLAEVAHQYALGIEPVALMRAQMDVVHKVTVAQISGTVGARSAEERQALEDWGKALTAGQSHRLWQLMLKGYEEVRSAPDPLAAAQMALLRVLHAADMPDPSGLVKKLEELAARPVIVQASEPSPGEGGAAARGAPAAVALDWEALVEQVEHLSPLTGSSMRLSVRVIELRQGFLRYELAPGLPGDPTQDIRKALQAATGEAWTVEQARAVDGVIALPSLVEAKELREKQAENEMMDDPLVKAAFAAFPQATIVDEERSIEHSRKPWSRRA